MVHEFLVEPADSPSKREILGHALSLFVRDGLRETSIRAIADASGYTNPALYKFFDSKDALALHLFERCYTFVYERLTAATAVMQTVPSFANRLRSLIAAWVDLTHEALEAVLYVNETLREFWPRVSATTRGKSLLSYLEQLVSQGQREGLVEASLDRSLAVATLVGTLGQLSRQVFFKTTPSHASHFAPQLSAILYAALTARTP